MDARRSDSAKVIRIIQGDHARARWAACNRLSLFLFAGSARACARALLRTFAAGERARTSDNDEHVLLSNCPERSRVQLERLQLKNEESSFVEARSEISVAS